MPKTDSRYNTYADHFLGEKPLQLSEENAIYVNSHLNEVKKRSDQAYKDHKSILKNLFTHIDKPVLKITKLDIKKYFDEVLDPRQDIKASSKETMRGTLRSFFFHVESLLLDQEINYNNPVPSKKVYKFTKRNTDIIKRSEKKAKLLTKEQLLKILDYAKKNFTKNNKRMFIYFALSVCSGAREMEIATIKIADVNIKERYFETGFEKNARKSTKHIKEGLLFFFPKSFASYLKNYLLKLKNDNDVWLFPSTRTERHMSPSTPRYYYEKLREALGLADFSMHWFRHSLITYLKTNGCSLEDREMLLNHVPHRTQAKHYEHEEIAEKRAVYDKYFPYYEFPYF
ncbi:MAG: tyrosine-type recombinase/integrase [Candidatus Hodarchaeota archaeon]